MAPNAWRPETPAETTRHVAGARDGTLQVSPGAVFGERLPGRDGIPDPFHETGGTSLGPKSLLNLPSHAGASHPPARGRCLTLPPMALGGLTARTTSRSRCSAGSQSDDARAAAPSTPLHPILPRAPFLQRLEGPSASATRGPPNGPGRAGPCISQAGPSSTAAHSIAPGPILKRGRSMPSGSSVASDTACAASMPAPPRPAGLRFMLHADLRPHNHSVFDSSRRPPICFLLQLDCPFSASPFTLSEPLGVNLVGNWEGGYHHDHFFEHEQTPPKTKCNCTEPVPRRRRPDRDNRDEARTATTTSTAGPITHHGARVHARAPPAAGQGGGSQGGRRRARC